MLQSWTMTTICFESKSKHFMARSHQKWRRSRRPRSVVSSKMSGGPPHPGSTGGSAGAWRLIPGWGGRQRYTSSPSAQMDGRVFPEKEARTGQRDTKKRSRCSSSLMFWTCWKKHAAEKHSGEAWKESLTLMGLMVTETEWTDYWIKLFLKKLLQIFFSSFYVEISADDSGYMEVL